MCESVCVCERERERECVGEREREREREPPRDTLERSKPGLGASQVLGFRIYRGTSLKRNRPPPWDYQRALGIVIL